MASTFFGLTIGTSGLYAYQGAINTTAHNIANASTAGYSRQVAVRQAGNPLKANSSYGMIGTGVNIMDIIQVRSSYFDQKYWKNNSVLGEYTTKALYSSQIESYLNDYEKDGFTSALNTFFDKGLSELKKNAADIPARAQVINSAKGLTDTINSMATSLKMEQMETNQEIKFQVERINSLAQQIASLTGQINATESNGLRANDLRDQRANLIDELSGIATVTVEDNQVGMNKQVNSYVVKIDGHTLVNGKDFNTMKVVPRDEKRNTNDADGLYDVMWSNGTKFEIKGTNLSGSLKALIQMRDGNNNQALTGTATPSGGSVNGVGDTKVQIKNANINDINKLNISETGTIRVGTYEYKYSGFQVIAESDGTYTYEFDLTEPLVKDASGESVVIGENVDYKGIPYYMMQLNELVRTFSQKYNGLHNKGMDLNNEKGLDFFNARDRVTGKTNPLMESSDPLFTGFSSTDHSYYKLTAENFTITDEILTDPRKIVTTSDINQGESATDILDELIKLKTDTSMFKQGKPADFFQVLFAEVGVDTGKAVNSAKNQDNILGSITNQRLSISGVDEDEEAMNLVKFKNAYDLSSKVISVMNQLYDKLINQTGL